MARHAQAATAEVRVSVGADTLDIEVLDDGRGSGRRVKAGSGLSGMRERAVALGGHFEAGDRPEGGFRVWTRLPLQPGTAAEADADPAVATLTAEGAR